MLVDFKEAAQGKEVLVVNETSSLPLVLVIVVCFGLGLGLLAGLFSFEDHSLVQAECLVNLLNVLLYLLDNFFTEIES